MRDWSGLPKELVDQTHKHLRSCIDLLQFRSVCSSWRICSPTVSLIHPLPSCAIPLPNKPRKKSSISTYMIYVLSSPKEPQGGWLIKLKRTYKPKQFRLFNPLSYATLSAAMHPLPLTLPKVVDLSGVRISELAQHHVWFDIDSVKLVFSPNPPWNTNLVDPVIITIINSTLNSRRLALFRFADSTWSVIKETEPCSYEDMIYFKGKFYVVDAGGRVLVISPNLTLEIVISSFFLGSGDKMWLVESNRELLLVVGYNYKSYGFPEGVDVRFNCFKLDCIGCNSVLVKSLGDRMLFVGDDYSFSASASEFSGCKPNCIYFAPWYILCPVKTKSPCIHDHVSVYNMVEGSVAPLEPKNLFWPPPAWVASADQKPLTGTL